MPRQKYNYYTYKVINKINNKNKFPLLFSRFVWICRGRDGGYSMKSLLFVLIFFLDTNFPIKQTTYLKVWLQSGGLLKAANRSKMEFAISTTAEFRSLCY